MIFDHEALMIFMKVLILMNEMILILIMEANEDTEGFQELEHMSVFQLLRELEVMLIF